MIQQVLLKQYTFMEFGNLCCLILTRMHDQQKLIYIIYVFEGCAAHCKHAAGCNPLHECITAIGAVCIHLVQ